MSVEQRGLCGVGGQGVVGGAAGGGVVRSWHARVACVGWVGRRPCSWGKGVARGGCWGPARAPHQDPVLLCGTRAQLAPSPHHCLPVLLCVCVRKRARVHVHWAVPPPCAIAGCATPSSPIACVQMNFCLSLCRARTAGSSGKRLFSFRSGNPKARWRRPRKAIDDGKARMHNTLNAARKHTTTDPKVYTLLQRTHT